MPIINKDAQVKQYPVITIHSPGGFGKTRAAGTASEHFVRQDPVTKLVELSDLVWIQFDVDGIRSLQSIGLDPPTYDFSFQSVDAPVWLANVLDQLKKIAADIRAKPVYAVVVDTLTTVSRYLETYYLSKQTNGQLAYGRALADFRNLVLYLRTIPARQIWLCHTKAFVEQSSDADRAKSNTMLPGDYNLKLGLTQGAAELVRTISSLIVGVDVDDKTGKRTLVAHSKGLYETKNRYDGIVNAVEDVNLRQIFTKIEAFDNKLKENKETK